MVLGVCNISILLRMSQYYELMENFESMYLQAQNPVLSYYVIFLYLQVKPTEASFLKTRKRVLLAATMNFAYAECS